MTRSIPWQVQWKDPTWRSTASSILLDGDDPIKNNKDQGNQQNKSPDAADSSVLGVTSARVLLEELPKELRIKVQEQVVGAAAQEDDQYYDPSADAALEQQDISLVLTVTLSSEEPTTTTIPTTSTNTNNTTGTIQHHKPPIATFIELELSLLHSASSSSFSTLSVPEKQSKSQPSLQSICSTTLRWPGSMLLQGQDKEESEPPQLPQQPIPFWQSWLTLPFLEHLSLQPSEHEKTEGVVTATLCRLPLGLQPIRTRNDETATTGTATTDLVPIEQPEAADALEALDLLSLGLVQTVLPLSTMSSSSQVNINANSNVNTMASSNNHQSDENTNTQSPPTPSSPSHNNSSSPQVTQLQLCCVTTSGTVHLYHPWSLLLDSSMVEDVDKNTTTDTTTTTSLKEKDTSEEWSLGMATLLLGQDSSLLGTLQHNYPLCRPLTTIQLSVDTTKPKPPKPVKKKQPQPFWFQKKQNKTKTANPSSDEESPPEGPSTTNTKTTANTTTKQSPQEQQDASSSSNTTLEQLLAIWNPLVEPATAHLVTQHNVPTTCCAAGPYLAIAGRGSRPQQHPTLRRRITTNATSTSTNTTRQPFHSPRRRRVSSSTKRGASSTVNDPNWWEEKEEETTTPQETDPSDDTKTSTSTNETSKEPVVAASTPGGFVTFVSLRHYSETRTVYLPLVPTHMSYMIWQNMEFVVLLDDEHSSQAVAIRIDASSYNDPSLSSASDVEEEAAAVFDKNNNIHNNKDRYFIRRFQVLPIDIPQGELSPRLLCGSSLHVSPPALSLAYLDPISTSVLLVQRTLHRIAPLQKVLADGGLSSSSLGIFTQHHPAHVARIEMKLEQEEAGDISQDLWSYLGQGWCLFGVGQRIFFICWEGSTTAEGASLIQELEMSGRGHVSLILSVPTHIYPQKSIRLPFTESYHLNLLNTTKNDSLGPPDLNRKQSHYIGGSVSSLGIMPPTPVPIGGSDRRSQSVGFDLGSSVPIHHSKRSHSSTSMGLMDDIVVDALESISGLSYRESDSIIPQRRTSPASSPRRQQFSHREKSQRLLRQCSSWTQLEDTLDNRRLLGRQVPLVCLHLTPADSSGSKSHNILSFRELVVENGHASSFQQVLSWLSNREDYFCAASLALDLLKDADSLSHLWRHAEKVDEDDEQSKLEGLLDGIIPINAVDNSSEESQARHTETLTQLADMTVGCLTKGSFSMSKTLQKFLQHNHFYDPARACLMLVATTASAVSDDPESVASAMGETLFDASHDDLLWPVRCLLEIGVARGYLLTALVLLNVTIPDELRRRARQGHASSVSLPPMDLCKKLVTLIVASSPDAAEILLGLVDDQSRSRFWQSLDHEAKLVLSLTKIQDKWPLLRHSEVRDWAREELHKCMRNEHSATMNVFEIMPTHWLEELCVACLQNAGCDLSELVVEPTAPPSAAASETDSEFDEDSAIDGLEKHKQEIVETRSALVPATGSGGLDFDLLIPCLLLLEIRKTPWREGNYVATQSLLDAVCYLAGRHNKDEPLFVFDDATAMKQCALSGNVRAGANLIGGKNGFVLSCCDILIQELSMSMEYAESFFLKDKLSIDIIKSFEGKDGSSSEIDEPFELRDAHRHVLWLLDEHVLSVRTYGEFETLHIRGRVDPVFAARCAFRAWLCLTAAERRKGTAWLESWLRWRLGIHEEKVSCHRLVCAAIARALVWSANGRAPMESVDSGQMLGHQLKMESKFLVQIAQSCCGLVESVPHSVAEEIIHHAETTKNTSRTNK